MPTSVEQSDLNIAVYGGHGDSPRVVIAPASVEDAFYTAIEAVNIARKYNVPVIILSAQLAVTIKPFVVNLHDENMVESGKNVFQPVWKREDVLDVKC